MAGWDQVAAFGDVLGGLELVAGEHADFYVGLEEIAQGLGHVVLKSVLHCSRSNQNHLSLHLSNNPILELLILLHEPSNLAMKLHPLLLRNLLIAEQ